MNRVNFYFATLLITIAGSVATLLIVHVAVANSFDNTFAGGEAGYANLQKSTN